MVIMMPVILIMMDDDHDNDDFDNGDHDAGDFDYDAEEEGLSHQPWGDPTKTPTTRSS